MEGVVFVLNEDRRTIIRLISVLFIVLCSVRIIMGTVVLIKGKDLIKVLQGVGYEQTLEVLQISFFLGLILGIVGLIGAIGVLKFKRWALWITVIASAFFIVDGAYSMMVQTSSLFSLVVPGIYSILLLYNKKEFA